MADEEEITVTIEPEQLPDDKTAKTAVEVDGQTAADPVADLKGQFTELQATATRDREAREAAERARGEAERIAANAQRDAAQARGQAADSQYDTVVSGLAAAQAEAESAEQEYKAAYDAGDGTKMAAATRKMSIAAARQTEYEGAKSTLEARAKQPAQAPIEAPQRQQPSDPVEAYISGRTEPTARWLREHKDFITDTRKNAKLTAAHHDAVSEGLSPDTDGYFEHVEKFVGLRKAEPVKQNGARKVSTPPVAPVGSPSGAGNGGGATVTLTAGEARSATDGTLVWNYNDPTGKGRFKKGDVIGHVEMARRKQALQKQGSYDKSYTES